MLCAIINFIIIKTGSHKYFLRLINFKNLKIDKVGTNNWILMESTIIICKEGSFKNQFVHVTKPNEIRKSGGFYKE